MKLFFSLLVLPSVASAFSIIPSLYQQNPATIASTSTHTKHRSLQLYSTTEANDDNVVPSIDFDDTEPTEPSIVSCFMKYMGPMSTYPALALRFPLLATESQRTKNATGIALDFILDTAANTNTINGQVAKELQLENVGQALPGYGASGTISGGETYLLGDCTLEMPGLGLAPKKDESETEETLQEPSSEQDPESVPEIDLFMTNLTASALPIASPAAAGLLGVTFLNCFEGGVKFDWGGGIDARDPMLTFYGQDDDEELLQQILKRMTKVDIEVLDEIYLPTIPIVVNGVTIPALLDTGSPVTVFNPAAAKLVGLDTIELETDKADDEAKKGGKFNLNPFSKISENFKTAKVLQEAVQKGDLLMMMGGDGKQIQLRRTVRKTNLKAGKMDDEDNLVSFPSSYVYVGDVPGLQALESLKVEGSPAAILGMDVLKRLPSMLYRGQQNEVYF